MLRDALPRGAETVVHRLDPKPGGLELIEMKWAGKSNFQRIAYSEVLAHPGLEPDYEALVAAVEEG